MASASDKFARLSALRPIHPRRVVTQMDTHFAGEFRQQTEEECALARMIGATVSENEFGCHLRVRNWHATPEFTEPSRVVIELLEKRCAPKKPGHPEDRPGQENSRAQDPQNWLFLDTETTGISGGTGTYAFLIGIAWWEAGGLQIEQFLMRDFSEEHSVLLELSARIAERPVLVTFNGKTFDWPLLESRYVMTRSIGVPQLSAHLDLLHPARAIWKLRLGSVRLMELEQHVLDARRLGWDRADDVPSAMIPQFYFDYLRGRSVAPLAAVVRHNRNDLRGLAALFGKLNELLGSEAYRKDSDGLDLFGLSRFLDRRGEVRRARSACAAAREHGLPIALDALAQWQLAKMAKRHGEHTEAARIWQELSRDADWRAAACEELARFHERQRKDLAAALGYARQAMAVLRRNGRVPACREDTVKGRYQALSRVELQRFERLRKKVVRLEMRLAKNRRTAPGQSRMPGAA